MCSGLRPPQYALPTPEVSPLEAAPRSLADYHAHYATHVSHAPTLALSPHPHDRFSFESGSLSAGNQYSTVQYSTGLTIYSILAMSELHIVLHKRPCPG